MGKSTDPYYSFLPMVVMVIVAVVFFMGLIGGFAFAVVTLLNWLHL